MPKPPAATPHSDLDGVREDQHDTIGAANAAGEDSGDLAKAKRGNAARPDQSNDPAC